MPLDELGVFFCGYASERRQVVRSRVNISVSCCAATTESFAVDNFAVIQIVGIAWSIFFDFIQHFDDLVKIRLRETPQLAKYFFSSG